MFKDFTATTAGGLGLKVHTFLAQRGAVVRLRQVSIGIEGLFAQHLGDLPGDLFQFLGGPELIR